MELIKTTATETARYCFQCFRALVPTTNADFSYVCKNCNEEFYDFETLAKDDLPTKEERKIRSRKSYDFWSEIYPQMQMTSPPEDKLEFLFKILNANSFFGSQTAASYSRESMNLLFKTKRREYEFRRTQARLNESRQ